MHQDTKGTSIAVSKRGRSNCVLRCVCSGEHLAEAVERRDSYGIQRSLPFPLLLSAESSLASAGQLVQQSLLFWICLHLLERFGDEGAPLQLHGPAIPGQTKA